MQFQIRNKNRSAIYDVNDGMAYLVCAGLMLIYLSVAGSIISNYSPLKNFINTESLTLSGLIVFSMAFLSVVILTMFTFILVYHFLCKYKEKHHPENTSEKVKDKLNEPYVDKNDKEKVYLLHELIKEYGIEYSTSNQSDQLYLKLYLKDNNQYNKLNYDQYDNDEKDAIQDVINYKQLTEKEAIQLFDQYIIYYSRSKIKSIEEKNELRKRIMNKNM